jgi:hypothetical protein
MRVDSAAVAADTAFTRFAAPNRRLEFSLEHSAGWMGSDFDFTKLHFAADWHQSTFFKRRWMPNAFDLRLVGGMHGGSLPVQRLWRPRRRPWDRSRPMAPCAALAATPISARAISASSPSTTSAACPSNCPGSGRWSNAASGYSSTAATARPGSAPSGAAAGAALDQDAAQGIRRQSFSLYLCPHRYYAARRSRGLGRGCEHRPL